MAKQRKSTRERDERERARKTAAQAQISAAVLGPGKWIPFKEKVGAGRYKWVMTGMRFVPDAA